MGIETVQKSSRIEALHEKIREMARRQGVGPFRGLDNIPNDLYPENENVDEFLEWIKNLRKLDKSGRNM